jgi:NosR/NirI family nitrous oxide reductase transcriptional regulator
LLKKSIIILIVPLIIISSLIYHHETQKVDIESSIYSLFENVEGVKKINEDFYYLFTTKSTLGKPESLLSVAESEGYSGPIKIGVRYRHNGDIIGIKVISQTETPSFFQRLQRVNFIDQYTDRNIKENFELKKMSRGQGPYQKSSKTGEINAVTGATISCNAINNAVLKANDHICEMFFKNKLNGDSMSLNFQIKDIVLILLYLFGLGLFYNKTKKIFRKIRPVFHLISIIMLGFLGKGLLSITHFNNLLLGNFPESQLYWYLVIGLFLISILALGRNIYFAHICPFGIMQDYIGKIPVKKIKFKSRSYYKYPAVVLTICILVYAIAFNEPGYFGHEVFSSIFNLNFKSFLFVLGVFNLILSIFIKRFWCQYLCPVGVVAKYLFLVRRVFTKMFSNKKDNVVM